MRAGVESTSMIRVSGLHYWRLTGRFACGPRYCTVLYYTERALVSLQYFTRVSKHRIGTSKQSRAPGTAAALQRQAAVEEAVVLRGAEAGEDVAVAPEHHEHHERDGGRHAENDQNHAPEFEVAARISRTRARLMPSLTISCEFISDRSIRRPALSEQPH